MESMMGDRREKGSEPLPDILPDVLIKKHANYTALTSKMNLCASAVK